MTKAMVVFALVVLFVSLQRVTGSLEWVQANKKNYRSLSRPEPAIRHTSRHEILDELSRVRRDGPADGSGQPSATRYVFKKDSHRNGIIQYCGGDSKVIFVLMYDYYTDGQLASSALYRSTDYGSTFAQTLHATTLYPKIYVAPNNNALVVFIDAKIPRLHISNDSGETFTVRPFISTFFNLGTILFHPTLDGYFLVYGSGSDHSLYVSSNLGQTLTKLSDNVMQRRYQWGVAPYDDPSTVYYNVFNPDDISGGDFTVHLYTQRAPYGTAQVTEFDPNIGKHDDFLIVDRYMFLQKTVSNVISLWVSYDRHPFLMAHIPSNIPHQNYFVDSIKSLQALVIVEHTAGQYNLYLSEETGQHFSLSLPRLTTANGYYIDFEQVDSMNATYIANQNVGSATGAVRTLISFDNGGNWQTLTPPDTAVGCEPPSCSLHLHISTTEYWRTGVYSQGSAPGIIIAHGTTGSSLSSNPDLYLSRDGGATWMLTLQNTWGVTVLDHGGLIVAAKDYHQNDSSAVVKYSCDEGASWKDFSFSSNSMTIFGVVTEPGESSTVVGLYGIEQFTNNIEWTVIQISFTAVFTRQCQLADYYWWKPWDERSSSGCLLGSAVSIQRRKPTVCCLNSQQYNRVVNFTVCACVPEDFECDYGYMHSNGFTGPCVLDPAVSLPAVCQGNSTHYSQSKGYRKIGGDVCTGGIETTLAAVDTACCSNSTSQPTCPPCSSTSNTHVTGGVVGTPTNPVTLVLAVLLVIAVIIIVALLTVNVVLLWRLTRKTSNNGYQNVSTTERFVYHPNQSDTVHTNITADHDDDDEAPLQP